MKKHWNVTWFAMSLNRAMAYVKCDTGVKKFLLMCRTQIAPLKVLPIPRLEPQACLRGRNVSETFETQMALARVKVNLWSDSDIALPWIGSDSRSLKPHVANRVFNYSGTYRK